MKAFAVLLALIALSIFGSCRAAPSHATPATLAKVLAHARGGDIILLDPGTYEGFAPKALSFSPGVTLRSADLANRAVLTNFEMRACKGLTFQDVELLARAPGYFVFQITDSSDIHFNHVDVHGAVGGDPQDQAEGLRFTGGTDISVTNSELHALKRALAISTSTGVIVSGNRVHDLGVTGLMFGGGTTHVAISGNTVWDLHPKAGDHPDAIQFLTAGSTQTATDIEISRNVIYRGAGEATQGIFLRDQVGTLPFERVMIADNLVVGTGYNGILVMGAKDLSINGNELISNPGSTNNTWLRVETADGVTARKNRAQLISFDKSLKVVQEGNMQTSPVDDGGAAALRAWSAAHPETASTIATLLDIALTQRGR